MNSIALARATQSLMKREGDLQPILKTLFFESLKTKYPRKKIKDVLIECKGGSWGNDFFTNGIKSKVLRSPDIRFGFIDYENAEDRYFTKKEIDNFNLAENDILVIKSNGSLDLVGKSQIYKQNKDYPFVVASNFLLVLTPNQEVIYPEYLDLFLKSPESLVWRFDSQKTTTGLRNLNSKDFLNIDIPVPETIGEQIELYSAFWKISKGEIGDEEFDLKRIFSLTKVKGQLSNEVTHQLSLVKQLRQAFLREAMQGKLVPQNPADEPATELLRKIKAEKEQLIAAKKLKKEKPLPPIKPEEIPFEIPESWVWCRLGDASILKRGKSKHRPRNDSRLFEGGNYPFIQTGDVARSKTNNYVIDTINGYYNDFGLSQSVMQKKGTLCITIAANIAECGFLGFDACTPDSIVCLSTISDTIEKFCFYYIIQARGDIEKYAPATAQKNINLEILNSLLIPLPPLSEQNRIVQKLEQLMQLCDGLEQGITESQQHNEKLLQQVLREALEPRGEAIS